MLPSNPSSLIGRWSENARSRKTTFDYHRLRSVGLRRIACRDTARCGDLVRKHYGRAP